MEKKFYIATASKRQAATWHNIEITWHDFVQKHLMEPCRTNETVAEYAAMKKPDRDRIKDQGGFVGGYLNGGKRNKESVRFRQVVTLDADNIPKGVDFPKLVREKSGLSCFACYPTHSSTQEHPRQRLVFVCSRPLTPEEYEPVARAIAFRIGINFFDPTTYEPSRLMYWPSCSKDAPYECYEYEEPGGKWLDPDGILKSYVDWRDASAWPIGKTETQRHVQAVKKLGDPREKPGEIGAFCRAYSIKETIAKFLPDVYEKVEGKEDRYTYKGGTTTGGMLVYDDLYAYSHHATDPISGREVNAYDLVRLNKFGSKDEDADEKTPISKLPSSVAMRDFACKDEKVRKEIIKQASEEFDDSLLEQEDLGGGDDDRKKDIKKAREELLNKLDWTPKMTKLLPTAKNFLMILKYDPELKGMAGLDKFSHRIIVLKDLPWRELKDDTKVWNDADDAQLRNFISNNYLGLANKSLVDDAFTETANKNAFHQVRDWFKTLKWDGKPRLAALFIDFLGAEDTLYTRESTVLFFKGGVARIYHPGTKFDYCLVLSGPQGIGKSTILAKMGYLWYNDSIVSIRGKDPLEQIQGSFVIELAEMQATTRAENDEIKAFISRREDKFRKPYGKRTEVYPRQCIFAATTNDDIFLKDRTGGRRFVIIMCPGGGRKDIWTDLTQEYVEQCWAEAIYKYHENPSLQFSKEASKAARELQEEHTEGGERLGLIKEFLDTEIPENWDDMTLEARRNFLATPKDDRKEMTDGKKIKLVKLDRVCTLEIWCEMEGKPASAMKNIDARQLNTIMQQMPGWEPYKKEKGGKLRFALYGLQRAYVRSGSSCCLS